MKNPIKSIMKTVAAVNIRVSKLVFKVQMYGKLQQVLDVIANDKELSGAVDKALDSIHGVITDTTTITTVEALVGFATPKVKAYATRIEAIVEKIQPEADQLVEDITRDVAIFKPIVKGLVASTNMSAAKHDVQAAGRVFAKHETLNDLAKSVYDDEAITAISEVYINAIPKVKEAFVALKS